MGVFVFVQCCSVEGSDRCLHISASVVLFHHLHTLCHHTQAGVTPLELVSNPQIDDPRMHWSLVFAQPLTHTLLDNTHRRA